MRHTRLSILLLLATQMMQAQAQTFDADGIRYKVTAQGTVEVTTGSTATGDIEIPATVTSGGDAYTVTRIGDGAFQNNLSIGLVTLPETVTEIGQQAFEYCTVRIDTWPTTIKKVGQQAFRWAGNLSCRLDLREVEELGEGSFYMTHIAGVDLPLHISAIPTGCFAWNQNDEFTRLDIPGNLKTLGEQAFCGCAKVTRLNIEEGVETIGNTCFQSFLALTHTRWPSTAATIPYQCFTASGLQTIEIPEGVTAISDIAFQGCPLTELELPQSLTTIGAQTFQYARGLTELTIPDGVTRIGNQAFDYAFMQASSMTAECKLVLGSGLRVLGTNAFINNDQLAHIEAHSLTPPTGGAGFPASVYENAVLYVYTSALDTYKNRTGWKKFVHIEALDGTGIDDALAAPQTDGPTFDLRGIRVATPQVGGIYIKEGRKILY